METPVKESKKEDKKSSVLDRLEIPITEENMEKIANLAPKRKTQTTLPIYCEYSSEDWI